jgi:hypothetical protein
MTMGWHMVMGVRSLAYRLLHLEQEPQLRVDPQKQGVRDQYPTVDLGSKVAGIGNASGRSVDKFAKFDLTPVPAATVDAPLIELRSTSFAAIRSTWSSWSTSGNRRLTRAAAT